MIVSAQDVGGDRYSRGGPNHPTYAAPDALREEAYQQRGHAKEWQSETCSVDGRGSVSGGGRFCSARCGPLLHDVHWNGSVARLIRVQTGAIVAPTGASYLYHRCADCISIHTDPYGCQIGLPEGGTSFEINSVPFLFSGQRIPHHRKPKKRNDEAVA